jgi:hypothetical protein
MNLKLINEVDTLAKHMIQKYPHLRKGQALMNALYEVNVGYYEKITTTNADCFYVDGNIPTFWETITQFTQTLTINNLQTP